MKRKYFDYFLYQKNHFYDKNNKKVKNKIIINRLNEIISFYKPPTHLKNIYVINQTLEKAHNSLI